MVRNPNANGPWEILQVGDHPNVCLRGGVAGADSRITTSSDYDLRRGPHNAAVPNVNELRIGWALCSQRLSFVSLSSDYNNQPPAQVSGTHTPAFTHGLDESSGSHLCQPTGPKSRRSGKSQGAGESTHAIALSSL